MEIPGMNRYNPNFKALKPRSIGIIIRPEKKIHSRLRLKKLNKDVLKQLRTKLKQKSILLSQKVILISSIVSP
jgi:hypothetical protein